MTQMISDRPRAGFIALACALAPVLAALAGCGGGDGGVVADPKGTSASVQLECTIKCVDSDTLSTGQMEAHFYIVDDGTRTQAQAGFFHGFAIGYDVELTGGDVVNFIQGSTSTPMELEDNMTNAFGDTLSLPGDPYLVDIKALPTAAVSGQFQLVRPTQTLTSSVTLPAPFNITAPGNNATSSKTSDAVVLQLDAAHPDVAWEAPAATCIDNTGATWDSGGGGSGTSVYFATADSRSFTFDAARYMADLVFKRTDGTIAVIDSCAVTLKALRTNEGTLADGFATGSDVSAIQLRTVKINLK
jgi:hypothetical protein